MNTEIQAVLNNESPGCVITGDCLEVMAGMPDNSVDSIVTDPPYPNAAGHFIDGIVAAEAVCKMPLSKHWIVFWDDVSFPPVPFPLVARHTWHRTNTNRPDNCEAIYEFHVDGAKRNSRVFPFCVIYPGMTGIDATGHPTEKHVGLMVELVSRTKGIILDPFCGSGTTCVAAKKLGRRYIGIEISPKYAEIARNRVRNTPKPLFTEPAEKPEQAELFAEKP